MALILRTDGTSETVTLPDGNDKLTALQGLVGGWIEAITLDAWRTLIVNEEGKLHNLPVNELATAALHAADPIWRLDTILGDAVICTRDELS